MSLIKRFAVALLLVTLAGTAALAKTKTKQVEFQKAVTVNGTVLKAGSYKVTFDDMSNELSILKNDKVVVKTAAHSEQRMNKVRGTQLHYRTEGGEVALVGITFGDHDVVVSQPGMQATGNN